MQRTSDPGHTFPINVSVNRRIVVSNRITVAIMKTDASSCTGGLKTPNANAIVFSTCLLSTIRKHPSRFNETHCGGIPS